MQISLLRLITWFSFVAWVLGIYQLPQGFRPIAVFGSLAILFAVVAIIAFSTPTRDEQLDVDSNPIFQTLEPTIGLAFWMVVIFLGGIAALYLLLVCFLPWVL